MKPNEKPKKYFQLSLTPFLTHVDPESLFQGNIMDEPRPIAKKRRGRPRKHIIPTNISDETSHFRQEVIMEEQKDNNPNTAPNVQIMQIEESYSRPK